MCDCKTCPFHAFVKGESFPFFGVLNNYQERTNRPEEQRSKPPPQSTPAFGLRKTSIDECKSKPTNCKFTLHELLAATILNRLTLEFTHLR